MRCRSIPTACRRARRRSCVALVVGRRRRARGARTPAACHARARRGVVRSSRPSRSDRLGADRGPAGRATRSPGAGADRGRRRRLRARRRDRRRADRPEPRPRRLLLRSWCRSSSRPGDEFRAHFDERDRREVIADVGLLTLVARPIVYIVDPCRSMPPAAAIGLCGDLRDPRRQPSSRSFGALRSACRLPEHVLLGSSASAPFAAARSGSAEPGLARHCRRRRPGSHSFTFGRPCCARLRVSVLRPRMTTARIQVFAHRRGRPDGRSHEHHGDHRVRGAVPRRDLGRRRGDRRHTVHGDPDGCSASAWRCASWPTSSRAPRRTRAVRAAARRQRGRAARDRRRARARSRCERVAPRLRGAPSPGVRRGRRRLRRGRPPGQGRSARTTPSAGWSRPTERDGRASVGRAGHGGRRRRRGVRPSPAMAVRPRSSARDGQIAAPRVDGVGDPDPPAPHACARSRRDRGKVADQTIRSLFHFLQDRDEDRTRLLRRSNAAIEQERNRIARDLHDGPVQGVSAASLSPRGGPADDQGRRRRAWHRGAGQDPRRSSPERPTRCAS